MYICTIEKECPYKSAIDNECKYLTTDLSAFYLFHIGEDPDTACADPLVSARRSREI